jgi:hypothetical protein
MSRTFRDLFSKELITSTKATNKYVSEWRDTTKGKK